MRTLAMTIGNHQVPLTPATPSGAVMLGGSMVTLFASGLGAMLADTIQSPDRATFIVTAIGGLLAAMAGFIANAIIPLFKMWLDANIRDLKRNVSVLEGRLDLMSDWARELEDRNRAAADKIREQDATITAHLREIEELKASREAAGAKSRQQDVAIKQVEQQVKAITDPGAGS